MSLFPVPVTGQKIPSGWFGRLVRFVNSLVLRGDGSYLSVTRTQEGTLIKPTPYLIEQLAKSGGAPASGGGGIGYLDPSTATANTLTANQPYTTTAAGILVATGNASITGDYGDAGWCWVELARNSTSIRVDILELSPNSGSVNPATKAHTLSSITIPVAAGVTITPYWGTNGSATASISATFYT